MKPTTRAVVMSILLSGTAFPLMAQSSLTCGSTYTVARGDTLSAISARAYGSGYEALYQHNIEVVGADPNRIYVGQVLEVPCKAADGTFMALGVTLKPVSAEKQKTETAATEAASENGPAAADGPIVFTFNKASAPPFIINSGIIDLYLAEVTEVTEGRVQFVDPAEINRNPEAQYQLVTSGAVDGAYVLNPHLSKSHPLLQIPMLPLMGGSAEQTAVSLWRLHEEHLAATGYFDDAKLLGFVAAPAAHIWRETDMPVTTTESIVDKNMFAVPYFEGLDTRGPAVVREETSVMMAEYEVSHSTPPAFFMAHGAARATGVWTDEVTVTEVDYGVYTPTFSVILSNEAWDRISPQDQDAIMAVSGERLSARSASWDAFDNGHRSHMVESGLKITKADKPLLDHLLEVQIAGLQGWMEAANASGIRGFAAISSYKENLQLLEDRLLFR